MVGHERFNVTVTPPRALLLVNLLVHGLLAGVLLHAIQLGFSPGLALWSAVCLVLLHARVEHRRLAASIAGIRVDVLHGHARCIEAGDGDAAWDPGADRHAAADLRRLADASWRLRRVSCATRWLCVAELQCVEAVGLDAHARLARRWLVIGGDQLDECSARRLLRWLRAGPTESAR